MKKILSLTLMVFMLLGLTMSFALQPIDLHQHNHDEIVLTTGTAPGIPPVGSLCPVCVVGTVQSSYKAATCTEEGYKKIYCSYCKVVFSEETYPVLEHDWVLIGDGRYQCTQCGYIGYLN